MPEPVAGSSKPDRPYVASGLVLLGGLILLVFGAIIGFAASAISPAPLNQGPYGPPVAAWTGSLGAFFGFVIVLLGVYLLIEPQFHLGFGVAVVVLSVVLTLFDFVFIVGILLAAFGGILAIVFKPQSASNSMADAADGSRPST